MDSESNPGCVVLKIQSMNMRGENDSIAYSEFVSSKHCVQSLILNLMRCPDVFKIVSYLIGSMGLVYLPI